MFVLYQEWKLEGRSMLGSISRDQEQLQSTIQEITTGWGRNGPLGPPKKGWIPSDNPLAFYLMNGTTFITEDELPLIRFKK